MQQLKHILKGWRSAPPLTCCLDSGWDGWSAISDRESKDHTLGVVEHKSGSSPGFRCLQS